MDVFNVNSLTLAVSLSILVVQVSALSLIPSETNT